MPDATPQPPKNAQAAVASGCVSLTWAPPDPAPDGAISFEVLAQPTMTLHTTTSPKLSLCGLERGAPYTFAIRTVAADGSKSDPATAGPVTVPAALPSTTWAITSYVLVALIVAAGGVTLALKWSTHTRHGVAFACGVIALALLLLSIAGGRYGLWRAIIGVDGRVSTSQLMTALWTLLVAFALAYMTARTWFYHDKNLFDGFIPGSSPDSTKTTQIWDDYLVLLGGPFAALVSARGIISSKQQDQTVQKTFSDDGSASLKEALTDDSGNVDLVDSQYVLFNVVALAYVVVGLASTTRLPSIPAILLALTGSSAATYVLNKAVQNQAPTLSTVLPSSFRPGDRLTISGANLMPAGADRPPLVSIGGKQALVEAAATDGRVTAIAPPGISAGVQELIVTTAARASTTPRPVEVLADQPQVLAVDPPTPTVGRAMAIQGVGFTSALDTTAACSILIEGVAPRTAVPTRLPSGLDQLSLDVPGDTKVDQALTVVVTTSRLTSSPAVKVTFKKAP